MVGTLVATFAALSAVIAKPTATPAFAGLVGVSLSYAFQVTRNLNLSVTTVSDLESEMVSIERIHAYTQLDSEATLRALPTKPWPTQGAITFEQVRLRYRDNLPPVLSNVSFVIQPREKIGVVGRTGAGKSSLVVALLRLVELDGGRICIDGEDLRHLGLHDVRDSIAIIPQDPVLFSGSVRSNLDPFERYDDDALWTALKRAHLDAKVTSLDAVVDERGANFSVGERQLLCVARALLQKAVVLVMDEATASIDAATDAALQETLRHEFKECTCLTIAHRINTIMDADRILVMDGGTVTELDTPANLLANPHGAFASLVAHWRHGHRSNDAASP
ncbi:ATP-binding Cassette (ABC) Superfamily [Achlya hypogyna]|uniref:ATP-binding Cassette (ABC) Superfamily n=1 Tax=Achlya hypogyna TaxID=1202772 RepID=A0A0A7CNH8_ACHHY|nr:secreted protein [Achlya hypogyna]OQR89232.1 ATP-binding Cassette (ABC) Superfamily [Achlya hypogyna]